MKLKSATAVPDIGAYRRDFRQPAPAFNRNRLDTLFHSLVLAAGVVLSVAAAAQAAFDIRSAATVTAQPASNRHGDTRRVAECIAVPPAPLVGALQSDPRKRS